MRERYHYDSYGNRIVDGYEQYTDYYERHRTNYNFLAPFIKFRYKFFEFSYRGLLGTYDEHDDDRESNKENNKDNGNRSGFAWNNNQLMLGVYFGGR
jgi:hypothetical protein